MLIQPMYYAVFFDGSVEVGHKRIDRCKYMNLVDGIIDKEVYLDGWYYEVKTIKQFHIINSVDNTLFAVCDVTLKT